jgi:hypothetical protein
MTEYSLWIHIGFFVFLGAMHVYFAKKNTKKNEEQIKLLRDLIEKK